MATERQHLLARADGPVKRKPGNHQPADRQPDKRQMRAATNCDTLVPNQTYALPSIHADTTCVHNVDVCKSLTIGEESLHKQNSHQIKNFEHHIETVTHAPLRLRGPQHLPSAVPSNKPAHPNNPEGELETNEGFNVWLNGSDWKKQKKQLRNSPEVNVNSKQPSSQTDGKRHRPQPIIGTGQSQGLKMATPRKQITRSRTNDPQIKHLFVSRFAAETSVDDIKKVIGAIAPNAACIKLATKTAYYSSFCITGSPAEFELLSHHEVWPSGALIMPFLGRAIRPIPT
jgi:hypothetical protein